MRHLIAWAIVAAWILALVAVFMYDPAIAIVVGAFIGVSAFLVALVWAIEELT